MAHPCKYLSLVHTREDGTKVSDTNCPLINLPKESRYFIARKFQKDPEAIIADWKNILAEQLEDGSKKKGGKQEDNSEKPDK